MRRMLVVAAATCLLGVASAEEPRKAAPGAAPDAAAKAAEAKKKDGGAKGQEAKGSPPAPKGDGGPEKQKPCEPVLPCPID